ncbi:M50 family metallopeptidase [Shewanella salipaludis]|uniref:M50 family metallopeptidase n=1 Tax=Shewanella salipaludis TaxID=2723052 RepID=A0A972FVR9_9GAMM|nr:M50 family metallopeptidase [Shewanella salipaludis]NMH64153.1 M50 family metallopeptidase [Shewanella salipaludis]
MPDAVTASRYAAVPSGVPGRGRFILELLFALLLTRLPYLGVPFKWLESFFHELSHGLATLLSGGIVSHIQLFPNGAGFCFSQGGAPLLIGFAGYFGAACWGYLIFILATWPRGIRASFAFLGGAVLLSLLLWGRDLLTIGILLTLAGLLLLPLRLNHQPALLSGLRIAALMIMLNALASPAVLFGLSGQGDAVMLAQNSWLPAWFWVLSWLSCSAGFLYLAWRRVDRASLLR